MEKIILKECEIHGTTIFSYRTDNRFRCRKCSSDAVIKRRQNLKKMSVEHKGGKCSLCGYNKCISALEFHHLNPNEKEFQISGKSISWDKFVNLEYLSFKNDHLKEVPIEIKNLKKLKVLDLSGNDFKILPKEFSQLSNLEELFLNDEKNLKLEENIEVISLLPHLRILHLENDNLTRLPKNFFKLKSIETLYLNNNFFKEIPVEVRGLNQLNFLDLNNNKIKHELQDIKNLNFGFKINF
jgi:hypothetical protein